MDAVKANLGTVKKCDTVLLRVMDEIMNTSAKIKGMKAPSRDKKGDEAYVKLQEMAGKMDKCYTSLYDCNNKLKSLIKVMESE